MVCLEQARIVVVAGLWCTLWHPNQIERHFERAAEGQVSSLKNQFAYQLHETSQHKNSLLSQIESLRVEALQEIEDEYQACYSSIIEEFSKYQQIHEESLLALSFFWVYGRAVINAEESAQKQSILHDKQKLISLAAEKEDLINSFSTNYKEAVKEETERFEAFVVEHEAALKALIINRDTNIAALTEFMDAQIQAVEHQYDADIKAIETAAKNVINSVNDNLRDCLKSLDSRRKSMALNGALIIGSSLVACAVPVLLPTVGTFAAGAVQISAVTTSLSAADNLFNGNGAVGVNFTVDVTNYAHKPYVPPSYNSAALQKDIVLPNNHELGIELNPFSHNRVSSQIYSNGNTVSQQKTNISITGSENQKATYQAPRAENKQKDSIEIPKTTPNQTGVINWSRMAWRSIAQDKSPEVISWQQDNRNRFPATASFFDGISSSKSQRVVNAFADEFAGRPVMFVREELSLIKQGAQTKTAKFVENTAEALKGAQEFAVQDAARFIAGDTTQTQIFFETVGKFIDADFERFRDGQATVIGTAIAEDFKVLGNMTPEQLAAHLGHETGDAFLFFFAGAGLQVGGRALTKTMDAAITLAKDFRATRTFQSPLLFQFKEGTLYSGFPFDAIETQKLIIRRSVAEQIVVNDVIQAEYLRRSLELQKIFTLEGKLVPEVLDKAKDFMDVCDFTINSPVYNALLNKGNIEQWKKYFYRFELNIQHMVDGKLMPLRGEVHFYMNNVTKEVYYGRDYKIKLQLPNQPTINVEELFKEVFKGVELSHDCKM